MNPQALQELLDHHQIRQLLIRYCRSCDRGDESGMAAVYCEESWDDHGHVKCPGQEFARITVQEAMATTKVVSHHLGQSLIQVDGPAAAAETYFIATVIDRTDEKKVHQLGGRFVDRLEQEAGHWRIKHRRCVREWSISHPLLSDWLSDGGFIASQQGRSDISYELL